MTTKDLTTQNNALAKPDGFDGFDEDEVQGGYDNSGTGYLSQFPKVLKANNEKLEIIDSITGDALFSSNIIENVIVLYAHPVFRLTRGAIEGLDRNNFKKWTDEQKELAAVTYGDPWNRNTGSRGSFDANGYGQYLDNKNLSDALVKRFFVFLHIPELCKPGEIVAGTFGITAKKSFSAAKSQLNQIELPMAAIFMNLSLQGDQNAQGNEYQRLNFEIATADGKAVMNCKDVDEYRQTWLIAVQGLIENHNRIVASHETNVVTAETEEPIESDAMQGPPEMDVEATDDIPF